MKKCNLDWENGSPTQKAVPSDPHSYALTAAGNHPDWEFTGALVPSSP